MGAQNNESRINLLSERIKQLGEKSTQILLFLSFAMVSVATLEAGGKESVSPALNEAFYYWKIALFPVLVSVLPLREFRWQCAGWYKFIQGLRFTLLWIALAIIARGLWSFVHT